MLQTRPGDAEGSSSLIDGYATATRAGARRKLRKEGTFLNRSTDAGGPWSTVTGPGNHQGNAEQRYIANGWGLHPLHSSRESRKERLGLVFGQTPRLRCSARYN